MPSNNFIYKLITYGIFMPLLFVFMIGLMIYEWLSIIIETTYLALVCIFKLPENIYTMTNEILEKVLNGED